MRLPLARKCVWILLIVSGLLLVSCGVQGANGNGNGNTSTPLINANNPLTSLPKSTISFTASGALNGKYTITDTGVSYDRSQTLGLDLGVQDQIWTFDMNIHGYHGPGTYSVFVPSGPVMSTADDRLQLSYKSGQFLSWILTSDPSLACHVVISSEVPLGTKSGDPIHEIKGSFSCPKLAGDPDPPITLSDGQIDVPVDVCDSLGVCRVY